jgi:O-acetyl-ADP-ribose deacetylase
VYGYPNEDAAHVALETTRDFLEKDEILERVIFCVFLDKDLEIYEDLIPVYFPSN